MNNTCCICLDFIHDTSIVQKFSCNHMIHHKCFIKLMINTNTKFINCPLCRITNLNSNWPNVSNNKLLHNMCILSPRCIHTYKNGTRCKNSPHFFNYGYCHNHNTNILKKNNYQLFLTYINYLFTNGAPQTWYTKLLLIDMAKKLIIKRNINKLENLLNIFFIHFKKLEYKSFSSPYEFYKLHNIEPPEKKWVQLCKNNKFIF
jgi:hypothetical protein